ncbi:MAG: hypothetical protein ACFFD4_17045 [Candidatus Odinarchaeota archaeon]
MKVKGKFTPVLMGSFLLVLVLVGTNAAAGFRTPFKVWPSFPGGLTAHYETTSGYPASYYASPSNGELYGRVGVFGNQPYRWGYAICALEYEFTATQNKIVWVDYDLDLEYYLSIGPAQVQWIIWPFLSIVHPSRAWVQIFVELVDLDYSPYSDLKVIHNYAIENKKSSQTAPKTYEMNADQYMGSTTFYFNTVSGHDYRFRLYFKVDAGAGSTSYRNSWGHVWRSTYDSSAARVKINSLVLSYG